MVGRDLQIARYEGAPLHLCHISAAESVAEIRRAKELGVEVTAEVIAAPPVPHRRAGARSSTPAVSKMNPPLRSAADRAALIEALADGTIDCIATDHAPHRTHEKEQPFEAAPNGVIGLETAFAGRLHATSWRPAWCRSRRWSSGCRPARRDAFGLPRAGAARRRGRQPRALGPVRELAGRSRRTPPARATAPSPGSTLQGRCTITIAAGTVAHRLVEVAR